MKKIIAVILSVVMMIVMAVPSFAADIDYTVINPYDGVIWDEYNQYKTELHCHTNASDGTNTLKEMIEKHYELGYDIVAVSDHGTTSYSWTEPNYAASIKLFCMFKRGVEDLEVLKEKGKASNGNSYTVTTNESGDDFYSQNGGNEMLRVPFAIENNPTSFNNAHVNSFFVDYGNGILGGTSDYETPISSIDSLGGVSVINHPGEYTSARDEVYTSDAYNKSNIKYAYDINKFENLLLKYDSCIGIDINSKGDNRTRFDRKLWDTMLTDIAPSGRNIFAIASSDAHNLDIVNSGYVIALMPEKTSSALQSSLSNGEFFAASRYIGNVDELTAYANGLFSTGNKTATYVADEMNEAIKAINNEIQVNGKQGTYFEFDENASNAKITGIDVDEKNDTISIAGEDILYVRWISDGNVIAEGRSIDIDNCENVGSYVRAEIIGKGGIVYTEPFLLSYEGMNETATVTDTDFGKPVSVICDSLIKFMSVFNGFFDVILKILNVV